MTPNPIEQTPNTQRRSRDERQGLTMRCSQPLASAMSSCTFTKSDSAKIIAASI